MMKPGTTETLTVVRQAEFGFFLSDGEVDILLHEREVTGTIAVDETVTVFLYHDHQNRLSATMAQPIIKMTRWVGLKLLV
ncbi:S1 RNA-binding domain-containing protein [Bacillus sp. JCM 19041]|uniref:S1 RNA-binding domain-containing protein n=1 Tax=Bacillus sp. JCM 19041 TaxID=1460637 RepID=UPI000A8C8370